MTSCSPSNCRSSCTTQNAGPQDIEYSFMSLKFWSSTYFLLAQSELTRAVSVLKVFFFLFQKRRGFFHKELVITRMPILYIFRISASSLDVFFPSVLGITQCKQKPIFNINLSFFLIYFLCGKKGFFFRRNESFGYFR